MLNGYESSAPLDSLVPLAIASWRAGITVTFISAGAHEMTEGAVVVGSRWKLVLSKAPGPASSSLAPELRIQNSHAACQGNDRREDWRSNPIRIRVFVAIDITNTEAIGPAPKHLTILAGIVLIRTLLSILLEVEIKGRWPW